MSSRSDVVEPSRIAAWLVALFATAEEAESILGDLLEEFPQVAAKSGVAYAKLWYWRQTMKTIAHLAGEGFRAAPWTIAVAVVGGFLLRWFISRLSDPSIKGAIEAVLNTYGANEHDADAYMFWMANSMLVVRLIVNTLVGSLVAVVAKGQEMTATITLGLVGILLAVQSALLTVAKTGDHGVLWTLPHTFAFSIAVVIGGTIVRTLRSASIVNSRHAQS